MAKKAATKKKSATKKASPKKAAPKKSASKKSVKKAVKKPVKKAAPKSVKKPAAKKSGAKKASSKKPATKKAASKKPVAKKTAKSATKKSAAKASKKTASKSASKKATPKSATKKTPMATKKTGKKSDSTAKKPATSRSASKVSGKGVLIKLKRSSPAAAPAPEERVKLRHVNATEKSKGETPVTLHHRKPNKKELEEFRQLLLVRAKQLQGDVDGLEAEAFSDETQKVSSNHLADSSFEQSEQEVTLSMIENETEELKEISRALEKIATGTFGECEACGIDISLERLRVMPYTRICIHCRSKYEEEGGGEVYGVHPERRV